MARSLVLDLLLLLQQLLRQPLEARDRVLTPQRQVLLHVFLGQRIDGTSSEGRVRRDERHIHQAAVRHRLDRHSREELADQRRFGDSRCLSIRPRWVARTKERGHLRRQRRDEPAQPRRRRTIGAELGHPGEIEAPHDAESQFTTGENAVLRLVVDLGGPPSSTCLAR